MPSRKRKRGDVVFSNREGHILDAPHKDNFTTTNMGFNIALSPHLSPEHREHIQETTNTISVYVAQVVFLIPLILKQMLHSKMGPIREWQFDGLPDHPLSRFPLEGQPFFQDILHAAIHSFHHVKKLGHEKTTPFHLEINEAAVAVKTPPQQLLLQAPAEFTEHHATTVLWDIMLARTVNYMTNLRNHFHTHHEKVLSKFLKAILLLNLPQQDFELNRKTAMKAAMTQFRAGNLHDVNLLFLPYKEEYRRCMKEEGEEAVLDESKLGRMIALALKMQDKIVQLAATAQREPPKPICIIPSLKFQVSAVDMHDNYLCFLHRDLFPAHPYTHRSLHNMLHSDNMAGIRANILNMNEINRVARPAGDARSQQIFSGISSDGVQAHIRYCSTCSKNNNPSARRTVVHGLDRRGSLIHDTEKVPIDQQVIEALLNKKTTTLVGVDPGVKTAMSAADLLDPENKKFQQSPKEYALLIGHHAYQQKRARQTLDITRGFQDVSDISFANVDDDQWNAYMAAVHATWQRGWKIGSAKSRRHDRFTQSMRKQKVLDKLVRKMINSFLSVSEVNKTLVFLVGAAVVNTASFKIIRKKIAFPYMRYLRALAHHAVVIITPEHRTSKLDPYSGLAMKHPMKLVNGGKQGVHGVSYCNEAYVGFGPDNDHRRRMRCHNGDHVAAISIGARFLAKRCYNRDLGNWNRAIRFAAPNHIPIETSFVLLQALKEYQEAAAEE